MSISLRKRPDQLSAAVPMAALCRWALIAEAELTPKPGLVDRRGSGSHRDLSLPVMRRSAMAIEPYFVNMAAVSIGCEPSQSLREDLACIGRAAEGAMFRATNGSNSHKGAIWLLGLLVSAAAMRQADARAAGIAAMARDIALFEDRAAPRVVTHGDLVAARYGGDGARGEARRGFPHAVEVGLPALRARRAAGACEDVARLDALLEIMSRLEDTCLLYRGGEGALTAARTGAAATLRAGGAGTASGKRLLLRLDQQLLELNVSPGGSADLLAATLFLDAIAWGQKWTQQQTGEHLWNRLS